MTTCFGAHVKDPEDELNTLWQRRATRIVGAMSDLVHAAAHGRSTVDAKTRLARAVGDAMAISDLLGRARLLKEIDAASAGLSLAEREGVAFTTRIAENVPKVPLREAVRDLVSREPRLARTAEQVAELYMRKHAFSIAGVAETAILRRVAGVLSQVAERGDVARPVDVVARLAGLTRNHAQTVYRTNLTTAYTAGRFAQARDPDMTKVMGAFFRYEINDPDVRRGRREDGGENHLAAHGLVAAANDPIWTFFSPPAGYS